MDGLVTLPRNDDDNQLTLLELPEGWKPSDLQAFASTADGGVRVIGPSTSATVHKVGTSNAWLLLPPHKDRSPKQPKLAHWLKDSQGGAGFLELRPYTLGLGDLRAQVPIYPEQISVEALARTLAVAPMQIQEGLKEMEAFEENGLYSRLPEALLSDTLEWLVETLHETREWENVWATMQNEKPEASEAVTRHCWKLLHPEGTLDDRAMARVVARRLLLSQPVWSEDDLVSQWQTMVPGTTKVELDWLRGMAYQTEEGWHYASELWQDNPWDRIWSWKASWPEGELEPFLEQLVREGGGSKVELLLKHATTTTLDGVKLYRKR